MDRRGETLALFLMIDAAKLLELRGTSGFTGPACFTVTASLPRFPAILGGSDYLVEEAVRIALSLLAYPCCSSTISHVR